MFLELAENDNENYYSMMAQASYITPGAAVSSVTGLRPGVFSPGAAVSSVTGLRPVTGLIAPEQEPPTKITDPANAYVYIPAQFTPTGEGMYVREDSFDMLPDFQWEQLMDILEPYQQRNMSLFGLGKKGRARRKARREARQARKMQRMEARTERVTIRGESGGGALGVIGSAISNIFGGGAPESEFVMEPLPPKTGAFGIAGLPKWVMPVGLVGAAIVVLAVIGKQRKRK